MASVLARLNRDGTVTLLAEPDATLPAVLWTTLRVVLTVRPMFARYNREPWRWPDVQGYMASLIRALLRCGCAVELCSGRGTRRFQRAADVDAALAEGVSL